MRSFALALAATGLLAPLPALAQIESIDPDSEYAEETTNKLVEKLADPAVQAQLATTVAVMSDVLLDMPLAPLADALAQAGVEAADEIPHDTTLRQLSPDAGRVPDEVAHRLPQMMGAMASMAKGMAAMMPALEEMAARMKDTLPAELDTRD